MVRSKEQTVYIPLVHKQIPLKICIQPLKVLQMSIVLTVLVSWYTAFTLFYEYVYILPTLKYVHAYLSFTSIFLQPTRNAI